MRNGGVEFWNARRAVEQTADLVMRFVKSRGGESGSKGSAIRQVSTESGLSAGIVKRFTQPSRQPKSVAVDVWHRLRGAYLGYLRRQLLAIQVEIKRVDALPGPCDAAVQGLLDQAKAVVTEIERLL